MFGMREGLKLARAAGIPFRKTFFPRGPFQNAREKLRLRLKTFRGQPGCFTGLLDCGKIDVRGQILFAGIRQQVIADLMPEIGAKRAVRARRRKSFSLRESVINRHQLAVSQTSGGLMPPLLGGG